MQTLHHDKDFGSPDRKTHFHLYTTDFRELHDHDYWEFFIVLSGKMEHFTENGRQLLTMNMACLLHPWNKHYFNSASPDFQQMNICITDEYFKELLNIIDPNLYEMLCSIDHPISYVVDESMRDEIQKTTNSIQMTGEWQEGEKFSNFLKLIWFDIIKLIYRNLSHLDSKYPEWLNIFLQELHSPENLLKPVSELHTLIYFSRRHLARLFKEYTGQNLSSYMQVLKLNYAAMLLSTTDMGILEISSTCGYESLSHFIKLFKTRFKLSPKEYRYAHVYKTKK